MTGKYPRLWTLKGANPNDIRRWYNFGALASICTVAPSFREILGLPDWVVNAVQESWGHNPHLKRDPFGKIREWTPPQRKTAIRSSSPFGKR
ncbi:hypothetical protein ACS0TY_018997 [Phlomoides rotata]